MKTAGQLLYEHHHPTHIEVVRRGDVFRTSLFLVPNPEHQVPWRLLTARCQEAYEKQACGHHLFSKAPS